MSAMTELETTPNVWIGCLACYNGGRLTGEWVDAHEAADFVPCTRTEFGAPHEEWWVMDFENFDGLLTGECSPQTAQDLAELIDRIKDDGRMAPVVFAEWCDNRHEDPLEADLDDVVDRFAGVFESRQEWAWHALEEQLAELPEWTQSHHGAIVRSWLHDVECQGSMEFLEVPVPDSWAVNVAVFHAW